MSLAYRQFICLLASAVLFAALPFTARAEDAPLEPSGPARSEPHPLEAQAAAPDKSRYTLFNPTPSEQMREFQTDRPDLTEGPYTVDAGHFQWEMDLGSYLYDRRQSDRSHRSVQTLVLADPTLKLGLLNNLDVQLIATPFVWQRLEDRDTHAAEERAGLGDTLVRMKLNLWGNDVGSTALGLMPYVKIPTNQAHLGNHYAEGGLIVPFSLKLPHEIEIDAMTEFDVFHNGNDRGRHLEWVNSIALHKDLIAQKLNAYVEFYSSVSRDRHAGPLESADTGVLYALTPNIQLDAGINLGLTRRAVDYNPFVGLSIRF